MTTTLARETYFSINNNNNNKAMQSLWEISLQLIIIITQPSRWSIDRTDDGDGDGRNGFGKLLSFFVHCHYYCRSKQVQVQQLIISINISIFFSASAAARAPSARLIDRMTPAATISRIDEMTTDGCDTKLVFKRVCIDWNNIRMYWNWNWN